MLRPATRRIINQKARGHSFPPEGRHRAPTACKLTVSGTISLPLQGFFSTFPHGTCALSVTSEYLALARGQAGFILGFTCPALLGIPLGCFGISHTGLSPSLAEFSSSFCYPSTIPHCGPATPRIREDARFRLIPVRSPLLGKSMSFSFPRVTEMFHFSRFRFLYL